MDHLVVLVHDFKVPLVLAVRALLRDLLHVDLELLPARWAQDDPFAHGAASLRFKIVRYRISTEDGNSREFDERTGRAR